MTTPKLSTCVAIAFMAGCAGSDGARRADEVTAQQVVTCSDDDIMRRAGDDESTRAELAHLRVDYRDTDAEPTAMVNVRLASGTNAADLAARHGALSQTPVKNLQGWHTLTFLDIKAAKAAVRPLLCEPEVERAGLNLKRPRALRNGR